MTAKDDYEKGIIFAVRFPVEKINYNNENDKYFYHIKRVVTHFINQLQICR